MSQITMLSPEEFLAEEMLLLFNKRQAKMKQTTQRTNELATESLLSVLLDELMTMTHPTNSGDDNLKEFIISFLNEREVTPPPMLSMGQDGEFTIIQRGQHASI